MSEHDAYKKLGDLVIQGRGDLNLSQAKLSKVSGLDPRTLRKFETGDSRDVFKTKYTQLERALGWRQGAVLEVLNAGPDELSGMKAADLLEENRGVSKASALSIDELLMELNYRVRDLQARAEANDPDEVMEVPAPRRMTASQRRGDFDLAARDVPGGKKQR